MKIILFKILFFVSAALAYDNFNNNRGFQQQQFSDGSSYFGHQSHSVLNSNGNSVVVSRNFGANGEIEFYISVASPKIRIDGDYFSCVSLICAANAYKCHVTSETLANDRNKMRSVVECIDKNATVLDRKEFEERNPYPEAEPPYSRVANVDRDGGVTIEDSNGRESFTATRFRKLSKEEQEKLNDELEQQSIRINEQLEQQQEHFRRQMDEMQRNLESTFKNAFGNGFPFGNYNPFGNSYSPAFPSYPTFPNQWPFVSYNTNNYPSRDHTFTPSRNPNVDVWRNPSINSYVPPSVNSVNSIIPSRNPTPLPKNEDDKYKDESSVEETTAYNNEINQDDD